MAPRRRERGSTAQPRDVQAVLDRIEHWRRTRKKRRPMPEPLWRDAARLARKHGVYAISKALRVNHQSLKDRAGKRKPGRGSDEGAAGSAGFVEVAIPAAADFEAGSRSVVVELSDESGARLTIRLPATLEVDVAGLTSAWWSRCR